MEWIIVDTHAMMRADLIHHMMKYNLHTFKELEYLEKINFKYDDDKVIWTYFEKTKRLPYGFMRDYAVGLS